MGDVKKYIVLTADIVKSRDQANESFIDLLPEKVEDLNRKLRPISGFVITRGDEIQGVIKSNPLEAAFTVLSETYPLKFRFGIGVGSISTAIRKNPGEMLGPAFEYARRALEEIKKEKCLFRVIGDFSLEIARLVNNNLLLISEILKRWDGMTFRRFNLYKEFKTIVKVAEREKVSPASINKYINNYSIRQVINSIYNIDSVFS